MKIIRRFTEMLALIDKGKLERTLDDSLREALETLRAQPGEKGKAEINLNLTVAVQNDMVQIVPKLKMKLPEGEVFAPLTVWDHDGGLSMQHPSQISMFREVDKEEGDVQKATTAG
jgi:hypothetical protein